MQTRTIQASAAFLVATASLGVLPQISPAALNPSDPSIIGLYLLNDQVGSNPFNNSVLGQFVDTAPIGVAHNHDDLSAASPTWVSTPGIGTGTGLDFERSNTEYTRFSGWMATAQGNYANGRSFTAMMRINAESLADNQTYNLIGTGSHGITLSGVSTPNTARVDIRLRDQDTFWNLDSYGTTNGGGSSGPSFSVITGQWVNLFLIYEANATPANAVLKVAMDDGTTFSAQTATGAPGGFDTLGTLYDNAGNHWFVGSIGAASNTFDGMIESIVIWDKALTNAEADAINLTNVPEPAAISLLGLGALALRRRK